MAATRGRSAPTLFWPLTGVDGGPHVAEGIRVTQTVFEVVQIVPPAEEARASHVVFELVQQDANEARASQLVWEIIIRRSVVAPWESAQETRQIRRVRQAPHLHHELDHVYYDAFQLDLETGIGLTTGQGSDPQIMLQFSDDGGHTWSNEYWVSAGALGQYGQRAIWRRLGRSRDRIFRVAVSDPVKWVLLDAWLDVQRGRS